jgi:hypothetical protein
MVCSRAPCATEIMAMTAPTPMMIPSMVSDERSLFASRLRRAIWKFSTKFMCSPPTHYLMRIGGPPNMGKPIPRGGPPLPCACVRGWITA